MLSAGSRDSALTSHGVLQTRRLGSHLAAMSGLVVTHIFSSDLQRAFLTASAVLDAQRKKSEDERVAKEVVQLADIREKDFRSGEGVRVGASRDAFTDAETPAEMQVRAARFIDDHFHPLVSKVASEAGGVDGVVVVSHGIILNVILAALLQRYAPHELDRLLPVPSVPGRKLRVSWSNTGFVEVFVSKKQDNKDKQDTDSPSVHMQVLAVNCVDHLAGLKKTRGGIGSARFDAKQKTMDAFFAPAKRKREDDA